MLWLILGCTIPSAIVCWAAAFALRRWGPRWGLVDRPGPRKIHESQDRKSTRLNSSHTEIYTLSLHDALPIYSERDRLLGGRVCVAPLGTALGTRGSARPAENPRVPRSEEHTSELQSHRDLHSFPTRRSSDLFRARSFAGRPRLRCAVGDRAGDSWIGPARGKSTSP